MDPSVFRGDSYLQDRIIGMQDKTQQRVDDIMFGHPCGVSIA